MLRTLPNGSAEHTPATRETYMRAHDLMRDLVARSARAGVEAVDLANAFLVFLASSIGTGKLAAGAVAESIGELVALADSPMVDAVRTRRGGDSAAVRRAAHVLELAAAIDDHLADEGIAALAVAARKLDRGGWSALVETADQIADRKCRGVVACPACRAERLGRAIDEIERAEAAPADN